jgi:transcriptional regulator with GAF, ATPase, and Fis domain/tetratricopeptide (TPR) repeat protein
MKEPGKTGMKIKRMRWDKLLEVVEVDGQLARDALQRGDKQSAWERMHQVLSRLSGQALPPEAQVLFISTSLEFSNLSFALGQGFIELTTYLQTAADLAQRTGDRRSQALIDLHLGRLYYFAERRFEALRIFEKGKNEVEKLGDDDILMRAAEFIGLYYFIQGIFPEAESYFIQATQSYESGEAFQGAVNPSGPMWLSYCAAFQGHFHQAIGTLDYYRRLALDRSDPALAATYRAVLALVLLMIKNKKEAFFHLTGALQEARTYNNALAGYFAKGGIACYHFFEGNVIEGKKWSVQAVSEGAASGLVGQYASPIILEMIYEAYRQGIEPFPHLSFPKEFQRIMNEPNIHLKGVALRLNAMELVAGGEKDLAVEDMLMASEDFLTRSGDPVQLAKTWLEKSRMCLKKGEKEKARVLAQKAWRGFSGYGDIFFPDDLRYLLTIKGEISVQESRGDFLDLFVDVIHGLTPTSDFDDLLARTVAATNRFFGAERGGLFWFNQSQPYKKPELRAACNLLQADVESESFRSNLNLVFKTYRDNTPQMVRQEDMGLWPYQAKAALCIPVEIRGRVQAVLYHDNSYVRDCFEHFEKPQLVRIARSFTKYIENILSFRQRIEKKATAGLGQLLGAEGDEILTEDPVMIHILEQADRIAATDSSVLIMGETGVGKELLAWRLHHMGPRRINPFVIVDLTAVPDGLVESELFGHEKGAFTGADHQKIGRMELAHQGTIFIDEIGEIPKSIQIKLLRVIQEKTLYRVGGTRPVMSDFRLVVATNRDLASEVASGRFREDLYYRLNVVPFTVPPLRQRKGDIPLLARHYLNHFISRYNAEPIALTQEDERKLIAYNWPGNVRELKNIMEREVLLWNGKKLKLDLTLGEKALGGDSFADNPTLDEVQRRYIRQVLQLTGGKVGGSGGAAEVLGMKRTSLNNRMKKLGVHRTA